MKKLFVFMAVLSVAACSTPASVQQVKTDYQPQTQARVRLFGQNQKPSFITAGIDCSAGSKGKEFGVGGSIGQAFGSLMGTVKSESIGIAQTETTRQLGGSNGILSRAFYREFVIPAGKAANVQTSYIGLTTIDKTPTHTQILQENSCASSVGSFVPQAGKDYEVVGVSGRACSVAVYEVSPDGSLRNVNLGKEISCRKK